MPLTIISDKHIQSMLKDPRFLEIPCLKAARDGLTKGLKGCGSCSRKRNGVRMSAYNSVRNCLAGLPGDQRNKLKSLMKVDKVRVVKVVGRQRVPVTF